MRTSHKSLFSFFLCLPLISHVMAGEYYDEYGSSSSATRQQKKYTSPYRAPTDEDIHLLVSDLITRSIELINDVKRGYVSCVSCVSFSSSYHKVPEFRINNWDKFHHYFSPIFDDLLSRDVDLNLSHSQLCTAYSYRDNASISYRSIPKKDITLLIFKLAERYDKFVKRYQLNQPLTDFSPSNSPSFLFSFFANPLVTYIEGRPDMPRKEKKLINKILGTALSKVVKLFDPSHTKIKKKFNKIIYYRLQKKNQNDPLTRKSHPAEYHAKEFSRNLDHTEQNIRFNIERHPLTPPQSLPVRWQAGSRERPPPIQLPQSHGTLHSYYYTHR